MRNLDQIRRRSAGKAPLFAALAAALALGTGAWTLYVEQLALQPQSKLWVEGTSTVRSFSCQASEVRATVDANGTNAVARLMTGDKAVQTVNVVVPSEKLDCGNGTMNEHMRKALKAKEFPTIVFRATSYDLARTSESVGVALTGTLTLGGVEKPITVKAQAKPGADGTLIVSGTREVRMTDFGLKPPTLMLGTMKVDEKITVGFEIVLKN